MSASARKTADGDTGRLIINSVGSLSEAEYLLSNKFYEHKYLIVSFRVGRDRSVEQNRLWRRMYIRISERTQIGTDDDAWSYCKLMVGVPILRRDDEGFNGMWEKFFAHLPYEEQLALMGANPLFGPDGFPVTRLFGRKQGSEYTGAIADHFAPVGVPFDDILRAESQ